MNALSGSLLSVLMTPKPEDILTDIPSITISALKVFKLTFSTSSREKFKHPNK